MDKTRTRVVSVNWDKLKECTSWGILCVYLKSAHQEELTNIDYCGYTVSVFVGSFNWYKIGLNRVAKNNLCSCLFFGAVGFLSFSIKVTPKILTFSALVKSWLQNSLHLKEPRKNVKDIRWMIEVVIIPIIKFGNLFSCFFLFWFECKGPGINLFYPSLLLKEDGRKTRKERTSI